MSTKAWTNALDYEAGLINATTVGMNLYASVARPPSELAQVFADAWRDQLARGLCYTQDLKEADSTDDVAHSLKKENEALAKLIEALSEYLRTKDSVNVEIIKSWQKDFEREMALNEKILEQLPRG